MTWYEHVQKLRALCPSIGPQNPWIISVLPPQTWPNDSSILKHVGVCEPVQWLLTVTTVYQRQVASISLSHLKEIPPASHAIEETICFQTHNSTWHANNFAGKLSVLLWMLKRALRNSKHQRSIAMMHMINIDKQWTHQNHDNWSKPKRLCKLVCNLGKKKHVPISYYIMFLFQIILIHKIHTFCWIHNAALSSVVVKSPRCSQGVHRVISLTHRWWPTRSDMDSTYLGRGPWYALIWYFWSFLSQVLLRNFPAHMSWRSIHELTCGRNSTHIRASQSDTHIRAPQSDKNHTCTSLMASAKAPIF